MTRPYAKRQSEPKVRFMVTLSYPAEQAVRRAAYKRRLSRAAFVALAAQQLAATDLVKQPSPVGAP